MKFAERIKALFGLGNRGDEEFFDELADLLVEGDLGAQLAFAVADELKASCRRQGISGSEAIKLELKRILSGYGKEAKVEPEPGRLNVFLLLGVNGGGKTTSCAKLARHYLKSGSAKGVILAAGDTFRAAAIDQIKIHGERLGLRVVAQRHGSDPGAVLYDALEAAKADGADLVLADTAGRMHTKLDLVRELGKIDKIVASRAEGANYRRLLAIDATTGQNGLVQAAEFAKSVDITDIMISKLDSTAKGGIAFAVAKELGTPISYVGTGEKATDMAEFRPDTYVDSLFFGEGEGF